MKGQEIKAEERNAIFGEIILGYVIFEEASLKTNGSHWKPYLWRKLPLKDRVSNENRSFSKRFLQR